MGRILVRKESDYLPGVIHHSAKASDRNLPSYYRLLADHHKRVSIISIRAIPDAANVRYQLKTPYREGLPHDRSECFGYGTTHVIFEPLDFMPQGTLS